MLAIAASLLALLAAVALAAAMRRIPAPSGPGTGVLTWPPAMRWGVLAALPFSLFVAYAASFAKPSEQTMAMLVSGAFLLGSVYLAYCVFLYRVWWTQSEIASWHPLAGERRVAFKDVAEWRYLPAVQAFRIRGGGSAVWYSPMQAGLGPLHRGLRARTEFGRAMPPTGEETASDHE